MKRIYIQILSFLMTVVMYGQLTVDNFALRENDQSGMAPGITYRDPNGDRCALIKVFAPRIEGFTFYGGVTSGFLKTEAHGGEVWVFAPVAAQILTISHPDFGRIEYEYPMALSKGAAYELLLNIGGGRFVNINSIGTNNARISIDGNYIGETPIYNYYLAYGRYKVTAVKDRFEGSGDLNVAEKTQNDNKQMNFNVQMFDQTAHFGDVTVTVDDPNADIIYQGERVAAGSWKTMLKEGTHEVITRKADSDDGVTLFTVRAQTQNEVKATAPTPHTGTIQIYTRPRNVKATYDRNNTIDLTEPQVLTVGAHQFSFTRKGFVTQNYEYVIRRNQVTKDTVTLQRITYVKPLAFYFGGAFTVRDLSGLTAILGAVYARHDLQASYTFGLSESDAVYWGGDMNTGTKYKMQSIGVKYGYQFPLMRQLAITPQVGYNYNFLTASAAEKGNTTYGDGASSHAFTIGGKVVLVPMQHLYAFIAPEYMVALSKDKNFKTITNHNNFSGSGFAVHIGLLANF